MIITLTAGHSDADPGACRGDYREADLMEDLRNRVAEQLRWVFIGLVFAGIALTVWARLSDWNRGRK